MRAQLEDLAADGPTEEEMTRVRGQVRGGVVLGLEDNWSRMMRLGRSEIIGRYRPIDESLAEFDAVEPPTCAPWRPPSSPSWMPRPRPAAQ